MVKRKCKYCSREFEGINEPQVESQLLIHLVSKHLDKIEIKEKKGGK
jgi:hypothetical protein